MAPHPEDYKLVQRVAVLETEMKSVKEFQEEYKKEMKEQTKQIYKGLGALGALLIVAELVMAYVKK